MIRQHEIADESGNGKYIIFEAPDVEYVNPIDYYAEAQMSMDISMMRDILQLKLPHFPLEFLEPYILREANKEWQKKHNEINQTTIPQKFTTLLTTTKKREQIKLLKNSSITPEQLIALIFKGWTEYGYSFSQYVSEMPHNGLDVTKMPILVEIKKNNVRKVGSTSMTDGQLKQAIEHRKVMVAKFLDKQNEWHCFFLTYESLKGKESWKNGTPHYHYISDKFGLTRQNVLEQLKSCNYSLGSLPHISLLKYRAQSE